MPAIQVGGCHTLRRLVGRLAPRFDETQAKAWLLQLLPKLLVVDSERPAQPANVDVR